MSKFKVQIISTGTALLALVKLVKNYSSLELKESKEIIDKKGSFIYDEDSSIVNVNALKTDFETCGAKIEIEKIDEIVEEEV